MKKKTKVITGALLIGAVWFAALSGAPPLPAAAAGTSTPGVSDLEREAVAYFGDAQPRVKGPNGAVYAPSTPAHALQIKVNAYKRRLVQQAQSRDPEFKQKAEAALERARPQHAAIEWDEEAGNRELVFMVEDSRACGLDDQSHFQLTTHDLTRHPCFDRGPNLWPEGATLSVRLAPVTKQEPVWNELLRDTMKAMAVEARL